MERPLFVLGEDWRFRYVNPAGAALLGRTVDVPGGRRHLGGVPRGGRQPVRAELPPGRGDRSSRPASRPGSDRWEIWFRVDAFRTDGGLVVTYDDVTERRRTEEERAAAVAAREAAAAEAAACARPRRRRPAGT